METKDKQTTVVIPAKPAVAPTVTVGGMTLKKRAPGSAPATPSTATSHQRTAGPGAVRPSGPSPNTQKRMERFSRVIPTRDPGVRMNEHIRVAEIRVLDDDGQLGVMSPKDALEIARSRGLDLIEIVPNAKPPVCKIIDFGKWKYEQQKRDKQAKKSQHQQLLKEVRFHPSTDTHDFEFKVRHARAFIEEGHKVKAYVQFKGREVAYKHFGEELLTNFQSRLEDIAKVDQAMAMMGRTMSMVISPSAKKKGPKPEAKMEGPEAKKEAPAEGKAEKRKATPKPKLPVEEQSEADSTTEE